MLKTISTTDFIESLIALTCIYYVVVLTRYYRIEIKAFRNRRGTREHAAAENTGNGEIGRTSGTNLTNGPAEK